MTLSDWHVMENIETKRRTYMYGPLSDYEEEDLEGLVEIDELNWTIEDMCEITSNLLEDVNMHKCTIHPELIIGCCKEVHMDEDLMHKFMRNYMHKIFNRYEY